MPYPLLSSNVSSEEVVSYCQKARGERWSEAIVASSYVPIAKKILGGTSTRITVYVGYPLGTDSARTKAYAARDAVRMGANRIVIIPNSTMIKEHNYEFVKKEAQLVKAETGNLPVAVCLPNYLSDAEANTCANLFSPLGISVVKEAVSTVPAIVGSYGGGEPQGHITIEQIQTAQPSNDKSMTWTDYKRKWWKLSFGWWLWLILLVLSISCFVAFPLIPMGIVFWRLKKLAYNPYCKAPLRPKHGFCHGLNVIFAIFTGWILAFPYWLAGLICLFSGVLIPHSDQFFKIARFMIKPFGTKIVSEDDPRLEKKKS